MQLKYDEIIPLTFDYMFKRVFILNKELLKKFIISVLKLDINPNLASITIENCELPKSTKREYRKTVDILVTINNNMSIDIEINSSRFEDIKYRNTLYLEKIMTNKIESGLENKGMFNYYFYQLNLNIHKFKENIGEKRFKITDEETNEPLIENFKIVYKSLDYYYNLYYNSNKQIDDDVIWLSIINAKNSKELEEMTSLVMNNKERNKFIKDIKDASKDKFILSEWEAEKMANLVKYTSIENATNDGKEQGIIEGKEQGIIEGKEQGFIEGKEKNTLYIIKKMLENNIDYDTISNITGKSINDIKKIENHKD